MSGYAERLWFQDAVNQVAIKQAAAAIERTGMALPCRVTAINGSVVTVAFEVSASPWTLPSVTLPKAEGQWIRSPTQVGDLGMTVPADVYLGGVSGLGGGAANTTRRGNLTTLVWVPVASTAFASVNINAAYVSGPQGAVIQTENGNSVVTVGTSSVTITVGSKTWMFDESGFTLSNGVVDETHEHSQGADSHGDTEENTSGPANP